jgi:hypothetical protein
LACPKQDAAENGTGGKRDRPAENGTGGKRDMFNIPRNHPDSTGHPTDVLSDATSSPDGPAARTAPASSSDPHDRNIDWPQN